MAYKQDARLVNAKTASGRISRAARIVLGADSGYYREVNDRYDNTERMMLWVEEFWPIHREFDKDQHQTSSIVNCILRVGGRIVDQRSDQGWQHIP